MPKGKQYSVKRHYKKIHKFRKTKRGGDGTPTDETILEEGKKYGENVSTPTFFNPKDFSKKQTTPSKINYYTPEETISFIEQREKASGEFDDLTKKYESEQQKKKELEAVQQSLLNPTTAEEASAFFDSKIEKDCPGGVCSIMGGRKSRNRRRKRCKTRKYRKSRR